MVASNKKLGGSDDTLPSIDNGGRYIRESRDRGKFRDGAEEIRSWRQRYRRQDRQHKAYRTFMKVYYSGGDSNDVINFSGYGWAYTLAHVLKQCGDVLTRENLMYQATHILFQCGLFSAS
jgi:hypothetical protein